VSQASASWRALGSTASVVVSDGERLARARTAVADELERVDAACSRFRDDSDLARLNRAGGGPERVGPLLFEAIQCALHAAAATEGCVDPTVGAAMDAIGYDRDFDSIAADGPPIQPVTAGAWRALRLDPDALTVELPADVRLDLGATAKAWAADRAAALAGAAAGPGVAVLVSLGGDVAVAGAPAGGWPVAIADDHSERAAPHRITVSLSAGGLATSSTTVRRWQRAGRPIHHIVDPSTGLPATTPWRTVTVAAASCAEANAASTAAIVRGVDAPRWLESLGLPARLVAVDGAVVAVGGWPADAAAA
jgi:thiamine biosynthesis lipoprotein